MSDRVRAVLPSRSPRIYGALSLVLVVLVGLADYLTGHEILFSLFYLAGVGLAAWFVGRTFAVALAVISVGAWVLGDLAAGAVYSHSFVPLWNAAIILAVYVVVILLLVRLRDMQRDLEERVRQRTAALTEEMTERGRLEREVLEVGEAERRRIGRDLHDSLGQLLTGTALAGQVLRERLQAHESGEAEDAGRVVHLVEEAIDLTRRLARGLNPTEIEEGGLERGLRDLALVSSRLSATACRFRAEGAIEPQDREVSTHLYRIAQEAISNALKHARAHEIEVALEGDADRVLLAVRDDGVGLPEPARRGTGMGIRIMAHRAAMIGGEFSVEALPEGGTEVRCRVYNV